MLSNNAPSSEGLAESEALTEAALCAEHEKDFLFRDHVGGGACVLANIVG